MGVDCINFIEKIRWMLHILMHIENDEAMTVQRICRPILWMLNIVILNVWYIWDIGPKLSNKYWRFKMIAKKDVKAMLQPELATVLAVLTDSSPCDSHWVKIFATEDFILGAKNAFKHFTIKLVILSSSLVDRNCEVWKHQRVKWGSMMHLRTV